VIKSAIRDLTNPGGGFRKNVDTSRTIRKTITVLTRQKAADPDSMVNWKLLIVLLFPV